MRGPAQVVYLHIGLSFEQQFHDCFIFMSTRLLQGGHSFNTIICTSNRLVHIRYTSSFNSWRTASTLPRAQALCKALLPS